MPKKIRGELSGIDDCFCNCVVGATIAWDQASISASQDYRDYSMTLSWPVNTLISKGILHAPRAIGANARVGF